LRIDNVALPNGIYRILEMEAVFPDGLIYSYFPKGETKLRPMEVDVSTDMKDGVNETTIYFVLAESVADSSPILSHPARYYSVDGPLTKDDNISDNEARIPRLFPNAFLAIGGIPEFCIGFPLCKIIKIDGVFHIKNWTPPCFFIVKHFPMWERCLKLALSIREKSTFLSEKLKNQSCSSNTITGTEQILKQLLMILPAFEALVYSDNIRPYELYEKLANVLGAVCILRPTDMVPIMQPYNHCDIDGSIYPLISLIEHYISVIERGFTTITMKKKDRFFYYYLTSKDIEACREQKIYVGVRGAKMDAYKDIETWFSDSVIVSDFAIEKVRQKRIKGAHRAVVSEDLISKIMPGYGIMLFEVLIEQDFIKGEQNIHIFNPGDTINTRPAEINLYIPREKK
jgi:type VI secretion system protein ImpJ